MNQIYFDPSNLKYGTEQRRFAQYLTEIGLQHSTVVDYSKALSHHEIRSILLDNFGCEAIYDIKDEGRLLDVIRFFKPVTKGIAPRVRNATRKYIDFIAWEKHLKVVAEREESFRKYIIASGSNEAAARNYACLLRSKRIIDTLSKSFGVNCLYDIDDEFELRRVQTLFKDRSINSHNQFVHAVDKYIEWLKSSKEVKTIDDDTQALLDEKNRIIADLEKRLAEKESEIELLSRQQKDVVNHECVVANVFSEIANRYLQCMKNKAVTRRKEVKDSLHSIMEELKMHPLIPEDLQKCINSFDDVAAPDIPHVNINEYVIEKKVGYQVDNVEAGGTGITVEGGKV